MLMMIFCLISAILAILNNCRITKLSCKEEIRLKIERRIHSIMNMMLLTA